MWCWLAWFQQLTCLFTKTYVRTELHARQAHLLFSMLPTYTHVHPAYEYSLHTYGCMPGPPLLRTPTFIRFMNSHALSNCNPDDFQRGWKFGVSCCHKPLTPPPPHTHTHTHTVVVSELHYVKTSTTAVNQILCTLHGLPLII